MRIAAVDTVVAATGARIAAGTSVTTVAARVASIRVMTGISGVSASLASRVTADA
jgi:hypothetical protein